MKDVRCKTQSNMGVQSSEGARDTQDILVPWGLHYQKQHEPPERSSFPEIFTILDQNPVKTSPAMFFFSAFTCYNFLSALELT